MVHERTGVGVAAGWVARRFWTEVAVVAEADGFGLRLDARAVRTPGKAALIVPTRALAEAIAAEWQAQAGVVQPLTMPFTRSANAAVDKVGPQQDEVIDLVAAYGDADLICYRATGPERLVARQSAAWDPLVAWAGQALGAPLQVRAGVVHMAQSGAALAVLRARVAGLDAFELTAFHDLVALSGSLVIGLAVLAGLRPAADLWALSRIDEDWQTEIWGADDEACAAAALKRQDFLHAAKFYSLCKR